MSDITPAFIRLTGLPHTGCVSREFLCADAEDISIAPVAKLFHDGIAVFRWIGGVFGNDKERRATGNIPSLVRDNKAGLSRFGSAKLNGFGDGVASAVIPAEAVFVTVNPKNTARVGFGFLGDLGAF